MPSSQYQELSDEMKELEKRGESRTREIDTRVGALENRIIDLAEARELASREEGGETNEDVTRRLAELEAKLERMDEIAQRLESIEGRVSSLSDDHQLAADKMSTKSEALAGRFGELEWRFSEILEKGDDGDANLLERLDQLETQLKTLEETPAAQAPATTDYTATLAEHKQFIERNERVLRALAVRVARMGEDSSEK